MNQAQQKQTSSVIFSFFGPPGSGKGTLAERLRAELNFEVLSTGNLCRFHIAQKTPLGMQLEELVHKGHLIPDELITSMVTQWLDERLKEEKPIILDGFPRTPGQAAALMEHLRAIEKKNYFRVIFVELADEYIVERLLGRKVCSNKECQAVYSAQFQGTVCEHCGSALAKRADDKEEVIRERLRIYPSYKESLLKAYRDLGVRLEELNVAGMSIEEVFNTFKAML